MRFHITSIQVDVVLDGWNKTIAIDDRDILPLQNVHLVGTGHKKIDISFRILVGNVPYLIDLPVTLNCTRGAHISMELPSKAMATSDNHSTYVDLKNPSYHFVDLTPVKRSANIIPVYHLTIPKPVTE